jgi:hypothetical protein
VRTGWLLAAALSIAACAHEPAAPERPALRLLLQPQAMAGPEAEAPPSLEQFPQCRAEILGFLAVARLARRSEDSSVFEDALGTLARQALDCMEEDGGEADPLIEARDLTSRGRAS